MKSLRGSKSQDIIFAGTQNRKSLGFAESSLVFDNSDGTLPIEYTEVTVTRKLYRSGETGYFINKVPCRLKDVLELFMDTGIGKDGYSIIGQGKIDEILRRKRRERQLEVATLYADQDPHEAYNWPFADDLEKNFKENEDSMYLQEYIVNKNFRYVIQELERISREEQSGSKS